MLWPPPSVNRSDILITSSAPCFVVNEVFSDTVIACPVVVSSAAKAIAGSILSSMARTSSKLVTLLFIHFSFGSYYQSASCSFRHAPLQDKRACAFISGDLRFRGVFFADDPSEISAKTNHASL